jgi:DnaJ-class molecular chaperone
MAQLDPYKKLGVSKSATQAEIKNAYRALAKKFHPDLNPGNKQAERNFKDVSAAYELIGTPEERARYDRGEVDAENASAQAARAQGRRGPFYYQTQDDPGARYSETFRSGQSGGFDDDLFETLFRGNRSGARRGGGGGDVPGEDAQYQMEIDLKETVSGGEREITLPNGKRLSVNIPRGITNGARLRFAGQGGPGIGKGPPGDAYIEIRVKPSPLFRTEGNDLVLEQAVPLAEAVLGGEIKVPTIDGSVLLKIPPKINTGVKLRLPGKGLFDRATGKRGDQIVVASVHLPEPIDPELEQAIRAWHEHRTASRGTK